MTPELRQLRYFVAVAEELNFTQAARRLRIAQQSLSAQIRQLEHQLGVDLFQRTTRQVELTEAGAALLVDARDVLAAAERAIARVRLVGGLRAADVDLSSDLERGDAGLLLQEARLVVVNARALGALREVLVEALGDTGARAVLLRFGFANGVADFEQIAASYEFASEEELLRLGPIVHSWEGAVRVVPGELRFDRDSGAFDFAGDWVGSWEADESRRRAGPVVSPVCWTLTGYASGWASAFFGAPLVALETSCAGVGDATCSWRIRPPADWGDEAKDTLPALAPAFELLFSSSKEPA